MKAWEEMRAPEDVHNIIIRSLENNNHTYQSSAPRGRKPGNDPRQAPPGPPAEGHTKRPPVFRFPAEPSWIGFNESAARITPGDPLPVWPVWNALSGLPHVGDGFPRRCRGLAKEVHLRCVQTVPTRRCGQFKRHAPNHMLRPKSNGPDQTKWDGSNRIIAIGACRLQATAKAHGKPAPAPFHSPTRQLMRPSRSPAVAQLQPESN